MIDSNPSNLLENANGEIQHSNIVYHSKGSMLDRNSLIQQGIQKNNLFAQPSVPLRYLGGVHSLNNSAQKLFQHKQQI